MIEKLIIEETDSVAIIAPHPDDECLGVASALLRFPEKTDVYVLTDGSWGNKERSIEEEAVVRKKQFEAEMAYVKPRRYEWIGVEDTKLKKHYEAADKIDFTQYTKVFLPWHESLHPDHRAAADMCCRAISAQKATPECFSYEVNAPFHRPTHYVDITDIVEEKRKLIRFHEDQVQQEDITMSLNAFRAAQLIMKPEVKSAECFLKIDAYEKSYNNDVLMKLHKFKEDFGLYERLEEKGWQPQRGNYDLVYTRAGLPEGQTPEAILGNLWEDFNIHRPADYHSPSMSVSDIIAIKQGGEVSYHYCDSVGFKELPGFNQPENYLKTAEMSTEDDYGMIDGIINNGPKTPTVAELEAQVNAGQTISLMDLAAAVQAEKQDRPKSSEPLMKEQKPSILERLKQPLPKQANKTAPYRSAEMEI